MTSTHPAGMATNYPISHRSSLISSAGNPSSSTPTIISSPSTTTPITNNAQISQPQPQPQLPDILERPRDKTRNQEVAASALAFLYSEILSYTQNRVTGIADLEKRSVHSIQFTFSHMIQTLVSFSLPPSLSGYL